LAGDEEGISRRGFLAGLGALGLVAVAGGVVLARSGDDADRLQAKSLPAGIQIGLVYRLSTRGSRACTACKRHGANRFYRLKGLADADRAHPGCNCRILPQRVPDDLYRQWFLRAGGDLTPVFDGRLAGANG
jgi:hypothetical protein